MIFRNINTPPLICIGKVVAWLKEYHNAVCFHLPVSKHSRDQERWCGPPRGVIKINFDGACGGEGDRLGLGFVAREYAGKSLMTGSKTLYEDSAEDFEIRALSQGMSVAKDQWWDCVSFEGDCKDNIAAVN